MPVSKRTVDNRNKSTAKQPVLTNDGERSHNYKQLHTSPLDSVQIASDISSTLQHQNSTVNERACHIKKCLSNSLQLELAQSETKLRSPPTVSFTAISCPRLSYLKFWADNIQHTWLPSFNTVVSNCEKSRTACHDDIINLLTAIRSVPWFLHVMQMEFVVCYFCFLFADSVCLSVCLSFFCFMGNVAGFK